MTPKEFKLAVRQLALDTGLADRDLSTRSQLMSDYGPIDDAVMEFARRVENDILNVVKQKSELLKAEKEAKEYQRWKQKTDAAIDRMNAATRAGYGWDYPGARQGMPRDVAEAIKAHKRQAA